MSDPGNQNTPPPPPVPPLQDETTTMAAVTVKILSSIVPAVVTEVTQVTEEVTTAVTTTNTSDSDHTYRKSTFVQTVAGEGIAGACVWAAIFITCHQIYQYLRYVQLADTNEKLMRL